MGHFMGNVPMGMVVLVTPQREPLLYDWASMWFRPGHEGILTGIPLPPPFVTTNNHGLVFARNASRGHDGNILLLLEWVDSLRS